LPILLKAVGGDRPETTLVVMKPFIEGIGLDWKTQHRKLMAHPVVSKSVVMITMKTPAGDANPSKAVADHWRRPKRSLSQIQAVSSIILLIRLTVQRSFEPRRKKPDYPPARTVRATGAYVVG
jgi:P22_AR N-terminal domain